MTDHDDFFDAFWPDEPRRHVDPAWTVHLRDQLYAGVRDLTSDENVSALYAIACKLHQRGNVEAAEALRSLVIALDSWRFALEWGERLDDAGAA